MAIERDTARRLAKVLHRLKRANFIERKRREISAVYCSVCGELIRGLMVDHDFGITREHNGKKIVQERLALGTLNNYREIAFAMSDGSRHVTNACAGCAGELIADAELREAVYASDLAQWEDEGGPIHESWRMREPISVLEIAPQIT
jgi:hypothetical protein